MPQASKTNYTQVLPGFDAVVDEGRVARDARAQKRRCRSHVHILGHLDHIALINYDVARVAALRDAAWLLGLGARGAVCPLHTTRASAQILVAIFALLARAARVGETSNASDIPNLHWMQLSAPSSCSETSTQTYALAQAQADKPTQTHAHRTTRTRKQKTTHTHLELGDARSHCLHSTEDLVANAERVGLANVTPLALGGVYVTVANSRVGDLNVHVCRTNGTAADLVVHHLAGCIRAGDRIGVKHHVVQRAICVVHMLRPLYMHDCCNE